jgi:hypothetical protein
MRHRRPLHHHGRRELADGRGTSVVSRRAGMPRVVEQPLDVAIVAVTDPGKHRPASAADAAELLADLAALGLQPEHLLDRAIDVAADDGLVRSDAQESSSSRPGTRAVPGKRQRASGRSKSGAR